MTSFWMLSALLVLAALPFVAWPLLCKTAKNNDVLRDAANLEILRDQAAELDKDLNNSLLTQDAYDQGKRELQVRLLDEVKSTDKPQLEARNPAKVLAVVLMALIPLVSGGLYLKLGNSKALLPVSQQGVSAEGFGVLRSEAALQELEAKMQKFHDDPNGWAVLARSYSELQRYDDAVRAYGELVKLVPNEAQIWTNYADAMAMKNGQSLLGEPTKFLAKALELEPENTTALALAGSAGMERGDYVAAVTYWQKLLTLLPADYPEINMVRDGIKQARQFLAMQPGGKEQLAKLPELAEPAKPAADAAKAITGKVTLSAALKAKASPDDFVFILARAAEGPKMPLAVIRKQVKDLPLEFTLDDSMAMQPQMKLSGFDQVVVVARVSKTGTPMSQPGDLEGTAGTVKPGSKGLNIVIDTVK
ncbi:MAG: c-type cytochrome biogenesis protein CcmI [Gallionella sp.]|nr:c-type cytochrome biogenesis protein CcmI [Gallionella sp.]MDD4946725.1 c-type cytochrome biogenesis protein CcmI [Gallionella sp.]MDD5613238.1 c-type cytochrome biogenesis protein CcmI [Gallionella sp.]